MADVGVTSSGGLVSAWADQSGNGNNASASSTARPTLTSSVIGSYPALRCDGVANVMSVASAANLNMGQGSFDVFAVVVPRKIGAFQVIVGKTTNSAADNLRWFVNNANQPQTFWGGGASAYPGATGTPTASGTAGMLEWGLGASAQQVRYAVGVSSGVVNSITLSGTGSNSLAMGICSDSGTPFFSQYDVTEIVIYKAFYMGVSERGQIVQYFISKYGASIAR
jgi:hypothetical protein